MGGREGAEGRCQTMPYALEAHSVASKIGMNGQSALLQSPTGTRSLTTPVAGVGPPPRNHFKSTPPDLCI